MPRWHCIYKYCNVIEPYVALPARLNVYTYIYVEKCHLSISKTGFATLLNWYLLRLVLLVLPPPTINSVHIYIEREEEKGFLEELAGVRGWN